MRRLHQELLEFGGRRRRGLPQRQRDHLAILGDGPYEEIAAFRDFMGYSGAWYSIAHLDDPSVGVASRISCYLRQEDKS